MSRDALLCMAGKPAGRGSPHARQGRTIVGAESPDGSDKGGDVIDIHVSKSGGWWLPFFLGAAAGVGGTVAFYRFVRDDAPKVETSGGG